jgi:transcription antitermination factor NusG
MKKPKFKVGDKVEVISGDREKLIGKTGVVVNVREDCVEIMVALSWFPISEEDLRRVK